jgi:hypothetical protein
VVGVAVGVNAALMWWISIYSFGSGELIDPVTPVVAAILDILVDVCAIIGDKAASWADRWQMTLAKAPR